jgi:hypothetical protein
MFEKRKELISLLNNHVIADISALIYLYIGECPICKKFVYNDLVILKTGVWFHAKCIFNRNIKILK